MQHRRGISLARALAASATAALFAIPLATTPGCALVAGAAIGAGAVAFVQGDLEAARETSIDRAWDAVRAAMSDLGYTIEKDPRGDPTTGDEPGNSLTARTPEDRKVKVSVKPRASGLVEINIRVGMFGDESLSRFILDRIDDHLGYR